MMTARFRGVSVVGATAAELSARVTDALDRRTALAITFVNPHSFNLLHGSRGRRYADDLGQLVVCADGIGVIWAIRALLGIRLDRLSFDLWAPDLFAVLAKRGERVFLLGGQLGVADAAADRLGESHFGLAIVGAHHGFVEPADFDRVASAIRSVGAAVVVVGAGSPLQERLVVELRDRLEPMVAITCGGYLDQVLRPGGYYPRWAYPLRLNWVVRLWREPRRLWRRYLLGNPRFVIETVAWSLRRPRGERAAGPGS